MERRLGSGRTLGALGMRNRDLNARFRDAITDDTFDDLLVRLVDIALHAERPADSLRAIEYILDRLLGKTPERVEISSNNTSIRDLLERRLESRLEK